MPVGLNILKSSNNVASTRDCIACGFDYNSGIQYILQGKLSPDGDYNPCGHDRTHLGTCISFSDSNFTADSMGKVSHSRPYNTTVSDRDSCCNNHQFNYITFVRLILSRFKPVAPSRDGMFV